MKKRTTSPSDLALNAAKTSCSEPIYAGRPNMGDRDLFIKNDGHLLEKLEKRLAEVLEVEHCFAMCNGTVVLEIAIRAMQLTDEGIANLCCVRNGETKMVGQH